MFHFEINLGDLSNWILTVANISFFIVALLTLIDQKKQIRELKAKEEERHKIEEKSQASLVSAWADEWDETKISGCCINLSDEPIYNVQVFFSESDKHELKEIFLMKPHEEQRFSLNHVSVKVEIPKIGIRFNDSSGRRWVRNQEGQLNLENEIWALKKI